MYLHVSEAMMSTMGLHQDSVVRMELCTLDVGVYLQVGHSHRCANETQRWHGRGSNGTSLLHHL
ncbi:hypothetical protein MPTK1_4g10450 [Marchantia polymorpha subsp. ruderalis]|uniref:Uncharacterized protein n=2 Tax=Marchantia polymorpha TaxID=3197 RepID=A0AAF6B8G5_MARPO|nr:hypothetical protein MARPO_0011s0032 [Marchantia polymorpha]BBN08299.1 hypothetical protein Mp_4g10450 [Marchantia polymorpha subsp. ruderalis]|eukprot:PTQ46335.1 hypothetical protein MARPO_0011s0032 [Marchantia polymorpha]